MKTIAQPTFVAYFELDTRPNALALLSATNGIFQTGGVLGTLTLLVSFICARNDYADEAVGQCGAIDSVEEVGWQL